MPKTDQTSWHFIDDQGTFELLKPDHYSYMYFPLVNQAGMMSCVTPRLNGDVKTGQKTFLLLPVSVEDLHNSRSARNFWVKINGEAWSVSGKYGHGNHVPGTVMNEHTSLKGGLLWHQVTRSHSKSNLVASVLNFVPANDDTIEIMQVKLTNQGSQTLELVPTAAIPIYARAADNIRDHRHVTTLFHHTICHQYGIIVKPNISFDERGHAVNTSMYAVLGFDEKGDPPEGFIPLVEDFIGEGGCLDYPQAISLEQPKLKSAGYEVHGFESIAGLWFPSTQLQPGESKDYNLLLGILSDGMDIEELIERYKASPKIASHFEASKTFWKDKISYPSFDHHHERYDGWLKWVMLQPTLRRIMGNSFLPYHDYGKGGRGWRDLWQDLLAPLLSDSADIGPLLAENFAGIRMDGSHATIVGNKPGEFIADRNSIPRVWMDHGAWPLLTVLLYLNLTGDYEILLNEQPYFKDHFTHRCQNNDINWRPEQGTLHRTTSGEVVSGTIFEHLLIENLTAFFNVGDHNIIRLEGGDWNDGLDMAAQRGESVAFSAFYAGNMKHLSDLSSTLQSYDVDDITVHEELLLLLDRISDQVDYHSIESKQTRLKHYLDCVAEKISGKKVRISLSQLSDDLREKADWLSAHIRENEWINNQDGFGWFNGYYDNLGNRVEGDHPDGVRMTLTGQVFPIMAGITTKLQTRQIVDAVNHYLYDQEIGGYRLNTEFKGSLPELGRAFLFAYGHKENGSLFNHMNVMFAYALYQQGLVQDAWRVLSGIYKHSQDFTKSRMYPGIPEYFNPRGRGLYPYLTGSAAWFIYTLLTESYGVKGRMGDLVLHPKLVADQFDKTDQVVVRTKFANKVIEMTYANPEKLSYGEYQFKTLAVNGERLSVEPGTVEYCLLKEDLLRWEEPIKIFIELDHL